MGWVSVYFKAVSPPCVSSLRVHEHGEIASDRSSVLRIRQLFISTLQWQRAKVRSPERVGPHTLDSSHCALIPQPQVAMTTLSGYQTQRGCWLLGRRAQTRHASRPPSPVCLRMGCTTRPRAGPRHERVCLACAETRETHTILLFTGRQL